MAATTIVAVFMMLFVVFTVMLAEVVTAVFTITESMDWVSSITLAIRIATDAIAITATIDCSYFEVDSISVFALKDRVDL